MSNQAKTVMVQGRLVQVYGDLFAGATAKVYGTQNPKLNKQGQQYKEYGFSLAVPKSACADVWNAMHEVAYTLFPNRQIPANFKMKFKDGDTDPSVVGRPGYAGCIVLSCKTSAAPVKFFRNDGNGNVQINEGIKCGDYVNVQLTINSHSGVNAGLYLNPNAVQFLGYGEAIIMAPSGDAIFGTQAPQVPQGASATPLAQPGLLVPPAAPQQAPAHYGVLPPSYAPPVAAPQQAGSVPAFPPPSVGGSAPTAPPSNFPPMPGFPQR